MSEPPLTSEPVSDEKKKGTWRKMGTWSKKKKDFSEPPPELDIAQTPTPAPAPTPTPTPTPTQNPNGAYSSKDKKSFMQTVSSTTKWLATLGRKKGKKELEDGHHPGSNEEARGEEFSIEEIDLGRKKQPKANFTDHQNIQNFFQDPTKNGNDSSSEQTPENSRSLFQTDDTNSVNVSTPKLCGSFPSIEELKQDSDKSSTTDLSEQTSTVRSSVELDESGVEVLMSKLENLNETSEQYKGYTLLKDIGIAEDINKRGLKRAKKHKSMSAYGNAPLQMEDTHYVGFPFQQESDKGLFCVFDGHSGKGASTALTEIFPQVFHQMWQSHFPTAQPKKPVKDLTNLFMKVYEQVDQQLKKFEYEGSTSTTVALWEDSGERFLQAANLGDSRAYLVRDNKPLCLTTDHKLGNPDEKIRVSSFTGEAVNEGATRINGLAVTRAFGDHFMKDSKCGLISEPSVSSVYKIGASDSFLILASDGLWDVLSPERVVSVIQPLKGQAPVISSFLVQTVVKSTKCVDNVTVIVVTL